MPCNCLWFLVFGALSLVTMTLRSGGSKTIERCDCDALIALCDIRNRLFSKITKPGRQFADSNGTGGLQMIAAVTSLSRPSKLARAAFPVPRSATVIRARVVRGTSCRRTVRPGLSAQNIKIRIARSVLVVSRIAFAPPACAHSSVPIHLWLTPGPAPSGATGFTSTDVAVCKREPAVLTRAVATVFSGIDGGGKKFRRCVSRGKGSIQQRFGCQFG